MHSENHPLHVLFLCTHNSARSILSEALLNHLGNGRFRAFSAGSSPRENQQPNPFALEALEKAGIPTANLSSKSWEVFSSPDAPRMDLIITVCDNAAGETCPIWPGHPATAHWGYPDPSDTPGGDEKKREAFARTLQQISKRLETFIRLPAQNFDPRNIQKTARDLALRES